MSIALFAALAACGIVATFSALKMVKLLDRYATEHVAKRNIISLM